MVREEHAPFGELIAETKDGEWGLGEDAHGHTLCEVIRGTDFARINDADLRLPRRWIPDHLVERKALRIGDILIETAGGTASQSTGRTALLTGNFFAQHNQLPVLCSSFARHLRVDAARVRADYLYYVLQALYRAGYMAVYNLQHTGVARFQFTSFKNKTVLRLASPLAQKRIAAILSAYDDLIANNQRRIALLETMAEEIYREWFVRMRFPGHNAGEFEGQLPARWTRKPLETLSLMIKRGISPDYADAGEGLVLNQKCIRDGRVGLLEARRHTTPVSDEKLVQRGDVLVNSTGVGTLGRVAVFDMEVQAVTCDSHITILRPEPRAIDPTYIGFTIGFLQGYFEAMAAGSTGQAELARSLIAGTKVLVPPGDVQAQFAEHTAPMLRQRRALLDANLSLSATRDALLPRLISGKLRVDHLDIRLPPSMQAEAAA